jgi:hypothetical protein
MATLLDFFKKIPSKKSTTSSPTAADTAEEVKSNSPQEKAKVLTPNTGKKTQKNSVKVNNNSHVGNGELVHHKRKGQENNSPKEDVMKKRAISDEESDDDDVTGRKVSEILHKRSLILFNKYPVNYLFI